MLRIWFNRHISSMTKIINDIKIFHEDVFVLYSHFDEKFKPEKSDHFLIEKEIKKDDYINYCMDTIKKFNINVFYPYHNFELIYKNKKLFEDMGVKLIFAVSPSNFKIIDDKFKCYEYIKENKLPILIPQYNTFNSKKDFKKRFQELKFRTGKKLCMKPTVSIFAAGFKIIHEEENYDQWYETLNGRDIYDISYKILLKLLPNNKKFKNMILMELLPGDEYSIDCICENGELITEVIRQKHMITEKEYQTLTHNEKILEQAKILIKNFNLSGFVNMQFREDENGEPNFLEINPRVSGGIDKCNLSGINFADIFIKNLKLEEINNKKSLNIKVIEKKEYLIKD